MGKKKITPDTNVMISALGWNGNERRVIELGLSGKIQLCLSLEILNELQRVMDYPKFKFTEEQKKEFLSEILEVAIIHEVVTHEKIITVDDSDNIFLDAALAADVQFIVSGDRHLLNLEEFKGIRILSARDFLKELSSEIAENGEE